MEKAEKICRVMETTKIQAKGDSEYPLRQLLITPSVDPITEKGEWFNEAQRKQGAPLKIRFRCLLKHRTLHYSPNKSSSIINACIVLHNMCIENDEQLILNPDKQLEEVDSGLIPPNHENENQNAE
ncbi:hypothetical protein JTB14_018534 [Gonioctena quinquepunctata]|nr:hypothetical protein JTB14_018534 [Gonioctena quinquepunctata]